MEEAPEREGYGELTGYARETAALTKARYVTTAIGNFGVRRVWARNELPGRVEFNYLCDVDDPRKDLPEGVR